MHLLDIELDLLEALDRLSEAPGDDVPEDVQALIVGKLDAAEVKRDNVARFINAMETRADAMNAEAAKLHERAEMLNRATNRLADFVVFTMQRLGVKKLEGATRTLAIQQNPASVEVAGDVPAEYLLPQKPAPTPGPDKRKIKAALEAGEQVPNCRIMPGKFRLVVT
jgi:Siphovirus Gp157